MTRSAGRDGDQVKAAEGGRKRVPPLDPALAPLIGKYIDQSPLTAARHLEGITPDEAAEVFEALPPAIGAKIFPYLQVSYAASVLQSVDPDVFRANLRTLEPGRAATIFMHIPSEARERLAPHVPKKVRLLIQELVTYPEDSVGRIMLTSFFSFRNDVTVGDAIRKIRSLAKRKFPLSYGYVVDEEDRLVGVINMHDLILAANGTTLESVMRRDVFALDCFASVDTAANELSKRRYFAAPVVDNEHRIVGIIKAEQLLHEVQEGIAGDIQKLFGAGGDEKAFSPISFSLRKRLPWLHVNLLTAFLAAAVVALFEGTIARITVLAIFLPVVAGQGGNAGAQSLAIVMRGLVMREIPRHRFWTLVAKETFLGTITGAVTGTVTALVAWLWFGNPALGLVVGLGMVVNLFAAGFAGASIPIVLKAVGLDPAQCSSIILTTVTDVVGFFAFLSFAVLFESYLI